MSRTSVVSLERDAHVLLFGDAACGDDDRTFDHSHARGIQMVSCPRQNAAVQMCVLRTSQLKPVPATRTRHDHFGGNVCLQVWENVCRPIKIYTL